MKFLLRHLFSLALLGAPFLAGADTIELPADAPATRTVELTENWRLGEDESDVLLGVITGAVIDDVGRVYLIDRQLSQILVIGPEGQLVTILGREGEGPGELNQPHALLLLDDGAVGAIQGFPGRIIGINFDGTPAGDITLGGGAEEGGFSFVRECLPIGEGFVASTGRMVFDMNTGQSKLTSTLGVYDRQGALVATIAEHAKENDMTRQVFDEAADFSAFQQSTAGADGTIYTTPIRDEYVLQAHDRQGHLLRTLHRPFVPRQRSQDEKDALSDDVRVVMNGQRLEVENKALDTDPVFRDLAVATDGRLFVTTCDQYRKRLPAGTAGIYDVISPAGQYLEELTLLVPEFDGDQDVLYFIDGTHFMVIKNFDAASDAMDGGGDEDVDVEDEAEPLSVILLMMP